MTSPGEPQAQPASSPVEEDRACPDRQQEFVVEDHLPEVNDIEDAELRGKVIAVWQRIYRSSTFQDPRDLPVAPGMPYPHFLHNRSVLHHALAVADNIERFHGIVLDRDVLRASVLLQDAGKFVEFDWSQNDGASDPVTLSAIGRQFQHGFWGAHEAINLELPMEVVATLFRHTFDAQKFPDTLIAKIFFYCDQIDMSALGFDSWDKVAYAYRSSPYAVDGG